MQTPLEMTLEGHYTLSIEDAHTLIKARKRLRELRKEGEAAACAAGYETHGTHAQKHTAIQAAWLPYREKENTLQAEITRLECSSAYHADRWRGIDNPEKVYYR